MKKRTLITISLSLTICLILSLVPGTISAVAVSHSSTSTTNDAMVLVEDTSLRKEFEKHFLMSDGSYQAALYNEPIHKMENGKWVEIDNSLELRNPAAGEPHYVTANGLADVSFAQNFGNQLVTIQQEDYSVSWGLSAFSSGLSKNTSVELTRSVEAEVVTSDVSTFSADEQKTLATKSSSAIQYRNALAPNVDLEYIVLPSRVKENIILQKVQDISHYVVTVFSENLSARLLENKEIEFYNNSNEVIFTLTSPYMYDSAGELTEDITVELISKEDGYYEIKMTPDAQWLNNKSRVYPVVIDPQVSVNSARTNIIDNYVLKGAGNQNRNLDRLYIGQKSNSIARAFIKYKTMPTIPATQTITNATMTLTLTSGTNTGANASAYKVTGGNWESGTITWANMPAASTAIATNISHNNLSRYTFSCKNAVQSWYNGSTTGSNANYGIMLRYYNESVADYNAVYSADCTNESKRPSLIIDYGPTVDIRLYGITNAGHDHLSALTYVSGLLNQYEDDYKYNQNIVLSGTVLPTAFKTQLKSAKIVTTRSHGVVVTESGGSVYATGLLLNDNDANKYIFANRQVSISGATIDYISTQDSFSNLDLCLFIGCETALDGSDGTNLTSRLVDRGAKAAVGFEESILCNVANTWTEMFYEWLLAGNNLEESVDYACLHAGILSGLRSAIIYGDETFKLSK